MKKNKQQVLTDEQKTDAYIRRKMMEAADAYEAELNADHSLDDIHLTDDMRADMLRRIAEADAEASLHEDSKDTDGLCCVAEKADPLPDCAQERAGENGCGNSGAGEDMHAGKATAENMLAERKSAKNVSVGDVLAGHVTAASASTEDVSVEDAIARSVTAGDAIIGDMPAGDTLAEGEFAEDASAASTDIRLLLSEEDRRALEIGKRALRFRKHRRCLQAAGILLVAGLGIACASMSSEASRIWWVDLWNKVVGKEEVSFLKNSDEIQELDTKIWDVCAEIKEKTDINALYFMYMPENMSFDSYFVREDLGMASMQYQYMDTYLTVHMIKKKQDSVIGQITDGNILKVISVETSYGTVKVHVQENLDGDNNFLAEFVQNECRYTVAGMLSSEEFIKIIENSFFF